MALPKVIQKSFYEGSHPCFVLFLFTELDEMILHMANDKTRILVWLHDEELDTQIVKFNL